MTQLDPDKKKQVEGRELARRSVLNFIVIMFDQVGKLILSMILNPIILDKLATTQYGIWQIMNRIVNYVSTPSGRPAEALKFYIAKSQHAQNDEDRQRMIGSAVLGWVYFSPLYIFGGLALAYWLPGSLDGVEPNLHTAISAAVALLILSLLIRELLTIPNMVMSGMNLRYKLLGVKLIAQIVTFVTAWTLLYTGWGLIGLSLAQVTGALALGLVAIFIAKRHLPWFKARRPLPGETGRFMTFNVWLLAWRMTYMVLTTVDVLLVGFVLNPAAVTIYTITNFIPLQIYNVSMQIVAASTASIGGLFGLGELDKVIQTRSEVLRITWLFILGSGLVLILFNQAFVSVWMGMEQFGGALLSIMLFIMVAQSSFVRVDSAIILISLDVRQKTAIAIATAIASLIFGYFGLKHAGLPGVVAGMILGRLVETIGYPLLVSRQLQLPLLTQVKGTVRPLCITALLLIPPYFYDLHIQLHSWFTLLPAMILTGLLGLAFGFILGFSRIEQQQIIKRLRKLLRRKGNA